MSDGKSSTAQTEAGYTATISFARVGGTGKPPAVASSPHLAMFNQCGSVKLIAGDAGGPGWSPREGFGALKANRQNVT
jgi:hypothetical protein